MTKRLAAIPYLALGLVLTTSACSSSSAPAGVTSSSSQVLSTEADPLVGEWTMTTLEVGTGGVLQEVPYTGQVIFTEAGTMAVQAANPDTTAPDSPLTVSGYEAYYGPVDIDVAAGTLEVEVESAAVRTLIGQRFNRNFEVTGDRLILTPTDPAEGFRVTYERNVN